MQPGADLRRIGMWAVAVATVVGIGLSVAWSRPLRLNVAPAAPVDPQGGSGLATDTLSHRPVSVSRSDDAASSKPSVDSRTPVFPRDPGLDSLQGVLKDLDDESSATSQQYLAQGQAALDDLLRELARVPLDEAELGQLRLADEPFRAAVGRAAYQRIQLKLSMTAQAILEGRCDSYPLSNDPGTLKAAVSRILDTYTGNKDDRQYVSTGGAEPGTGRVIQFYRAVHPEYFSSDEAVTRRREERRQNVREFLRRQGKLRG